VPRPFINPPSLWRRSWYASSSRTRRLQHPVISVGNISVGGRGKTPVVQEIARRLIAMGERPSILSRGYARRRVEDGVVVVSDGCRILADVTRSGDEPMLLARALDGAAVLVAEQRHLAGMLAERRFGRTVHVLDDGFQHVQLARDIDLVIVNGRDLEDRLLPFGRLREPVEALRAATAIVIDEDGGAVSAGARARLDAAIGARTPIFSLRRTSAAWQPLESDRPWPQSPVPVLAVAAIAAPERFRRTLEASGWPIADMLTFRDHHWFIRRDLDRIAGHAARVGAVAVVTTSKDAMRLLVHRPLPLPFAHVPITAAIEPAGAFGEWLAASLAEARA
jgi:tetraacyldisaccharide 4'-kinase